MTKIFFSKSHNRFYFSNIHKSRLPVDAVEVTLEGYRTMRYKQNNCLARESEVRLIAKRLLKQSDRLELHPYSELISEEDRETLRDYRARLLRVVRGEVKLLPKAPDFLKDLSI